MRAAPAAARTYTPIRAICIHLSHEGRTKEARLSVPGSASVYVGAFLFLRIQKRESESYLVDPASSHMLVSKTKPCMSKYKQLYRETADGSLKQLSVYLMVPLLLG